MSRDERDGRLTLTELYVVKFVLADVVIIFALIFAGPLYAVVITALLAVSVALVWYLSEVSRRRRNAVDEARRQAAENAEERSTADPVTTLQERYAAGDLTEATFERKLDQLLDADERAERAGFETEPLSLDRAGER